MDEISDDALLALTVVHSVESFSPIALDIDKGLQILEELFAKVIYAPLPKDNLWLDQLDILKAIRINPYGRFEKIEEYYSEQLSGYIDVGIEKGSDNYRKAIGILERANLPLNFIRDHELRSNYVRLGIMNIDNLDILTLRGFQAKSINGEILEVPFKIQLSEIQKQAIREVYALYDTNESLRRENINTFMGMWNNYCKLKQLREWWDSIQGSFEITSVGKVLAHANAQRCYSRLPDLN